MKKALIIVFAVAILGLIGLYFARNKDTNNKSTASTTPASSQSTESSATPITNSSVQYKDGDYTGSLKPTAYGDVQIAITVSGGKITNVSFIKMPQGDDRTDQLTSTSKPILKQATLNAQSANIDTVSGATVTADAYQSSLQSALDKAANSAYNRATSSILS